MKEIVIDRDGAGKRLDKLLMRYLSGAPGALIYAQLRKKNITLNGKKAAGRELLKEGDHVQCFFSDATWEKFLHPALSHTPGVKNGAYGSGDPAVLSALHCFRRHRDDHRRPYLEDH